MRLLTCLATECERDPEVPEDQSMVQPDAEILVGEQYLHLRNAHRSDPAFVEKVLADNARRDALREAARRADMEMRLRWAYFALSLMALLGCGAAVIGLCFVVARADNAAQTAGIAAIGGVASALLGQIATRSKSLSSGGNDATTETP